MKTITVDKNYINKLFPQFESGLVAFIAEHGKLQAFNAGDIIMQVGQYMKSTILILEGQVKLFRQNDDGSEFFMYYLEPGNACALSLICATKQETSEIMAKAVDDTVVLTIPISFMDDMMKQYKTWYYFVLETYRARFEELLSVIDDVAFRAMDERLYLYLQKQRRQLKTNELPLSHMDVAVDLNSSREVVSRLLKKMEQRGDVKLHRNTIEWLKS